MTLPAPAATHAQSARDEHTLARYRDLLKTAPPESIEQVDAEGIARPTSTQRQQLPQQVGAMLTPHERTRAGRVFATPHGIARLVMRAERRQPGRAERMLGAVPAAGASDSA